MPPTPRTSPESGEPLIRDRGDACPGALRLHPADDGRLARLRLPAGRLTARQAEVLAGAAESLGDGRITITSRGNAELRGLGDGCGAELAALLTEAGLLPSATHERVRNIVASPAAALDGLGHADVQLWSRTLDELLCTAPWAAPLSGRFLFVLDDGRGDVAGLGGDVTLIAEQGDGDGAPVAGARALLHVGGQAFRVAGADAPRAALAAADAFLRAAAEAGNGAWRVRELPAGAAGTAGTTAAPASGEATGGLGADRRTVAAEALGARGLSGTTTAEASGADRADPAPEPPGTSRTTPGAEGAVVPRATDGRTPRSAGLLDLAGALARAGVDAEPLPVPPPLPHGAPLLPGVLGARALYVLAPLGRLTAAQLRALLPADEVRLTPWRGAVVVGAGPERLAALDGTGLITSPDSPWVGVSACTGRAGCAKSLADVRGDAVPGGSARSGLPVHYSGCERRCGHPHGAWVDVLATADGGYLVDGAPTPRTSLPEAVATARTTR